jgi:hypothetical protein
MSEAVEVIAKVFDVSASKVTTLSNPALAAQVKVAQNYIMDALRLGSGEDSLAATKCFVATVNEMRRRGLLPS